MSKRENEIGEWTMERVEANENRVLVFVYGTLKEGHYNHSLLESKGVTFIDRAITDSRYIILDNGWFPCMVQEVFATSKDGLRPGVQGEVYEVDAKTLRRLDYLESEGSMYERREIEVSSLTDPHCGYRVMAYFYLMDRKGMEYIESGVYEGGIVA